MIMAIDRLFDLLQQRNYIYRTRTEHKQDPDAWWLIKNRYRGVTMMMIVNCVWGYTKGACCILVSVLVWFERVWCTSFL